MLLLAAISVYEPGGNPSSNEPSQHSTDTASIRGPIGVSLTNPDEPVDETHWTRADIAGSPFDSYTTRPRTRCNDTGSIVKSMPVSSAPGASSRGDADCSSVALG